MPVENEKAFTELMEFDVATATLIVWHIIQKLGGMSASVTIPREEMSAFDGVEVGKMVRIVAKYDEGSLEYKSITIKINSPGTDA